MTKMIVVSFLFIMLTVVGMEDDTSSLSAGWGATHCANFIHPGQEDYVPLTTLEELYSEIYDEGVFKNTQLCRDNNTRDKIRKKFVYRISPFVIVDIIRSLEKCVREEKNRSSCAELVKQLDKGMEDYPTLYQDIKNDILEAILTSEGKVVSLSECIKKIDRLMGKKTKKRQLSETPEVYSCKRCKG